MKKNEANFDENINLQNIKEKLESINFTPSGISRFKQTLNDFITKLIEKSIAFAETEKVDGYDREVTEKHVRLATSVISKPLTEKKKSIWSIPCQIGEYIFTAIAGAGASNLDKDIGILAFGIGLTITITLFVFRIVKLR